MIKSISAVCYEKLPISESQVSEIGIFDNDCGTVSNVAIVENDFSIILKVFQLRYFASMISGSDFTETSFISCIGHYYKNLSHIGFRI